jgi:hypothetical protein
VGFEPTVPLRAHRFSRPAVSTAHAPVHVAARTEHTGRCAALPCGPTDPPVFSGTTRRTNRVSRLRFEARSNLGARCIERQHLCRLGAHLVAARAAAPPSGVRLTQAALGSYGQRRLRRHGRRNSCVQTARGTGCSTRVGQGSANTRRAISYSPCARTRVANSLTNPRCPGTIFRRATGTENHSARSTSGNW